MYKLCGDAVDGTSSDTICDTSDLGNRFISGCHLPFGFIRINDYMFEESLRLLLRASWFKPLNVEECEVYDDLEDYYHYYPYPCEDDDDEEEEDEVYYRSSPSLRIGIRRWGDNGYVRSERQEARPVQRSSSSSHCSVASSSSELKKKEVSKSIMGRQAKRALKREAADKAGAAKHQEHLMRLGRK